VTLRNLIALIESITDPYQVDIDQIETFLAVGTFGGFRKAADALRVTQPAVSARIKALETALGARLFDRGRGGLAPSAAGRALRPHAEQVLHAVALARQAVHELQATSPGALQIAAALSICAYLLPAVLQRFRAARPRVLVTVRSGHSKEVLEMVLRGDAELGLARSLQHPAVETLSLGDDPLVLVQPGAGSRGARPRVRLAEVADRPLVFFDRGSSDWTLTHGLFRRAGLVPNVTLEVETIETAKRMVERGLGLAFLPHLAVAPDLRSGALSAIEISDAEPLRRSLDVVHPRHRSLSPDALAFLEALRGAVRDVEGARGSRRGAKHPGRRRAARRGAPGSGRSRSRRA
jgi:DNA-binding transcriptional LysR family regulator